MSCATPVLSSGPFGHVPETAGHVAEIAGHDPETAGHLRPKYAPATFGNLRDLQMGIDELDWLAPWRPLATEQEAIGLQRQLDREVTARHPLFGRRATVKGRRIDNDDIVAVLFGGAYVVVHLTWSV